MDYEEESDYRDMTREEVAQQVENSNPPFDIDDALRIIQEAKEAERPIRRSRKGSLSNYMNQGRLLGGGDHGNIAAFFEQLRKPCPAWFLMKYAAQLDWYIEKYPHHMPSRRVDTNFAN